MNNDTFHTLLDNGAILVLLIFLFQASMLLREKYNFSTKYYDGIFLGCIGILIMSFPINFASGVIIDARSIVAGLAALVFSDTTVYIAVSVMITYRILLGGSGTLAGILIILTIVFTGIIWKKSRFYTAHKDSWLNLYLFGVAIHIIMLLCLLTLPKELVVITLKMVSFPVIVILPIVTAIVGRLLVFHKLREKNISETKVAEMKLRALFNQAQVGIAYSNLENRFIETNNKFCEMLGYSSNELFNMSYIDIIYAQDIKQNLTYGILKEQKIGNPSFEKRLIRKDRSEFWASVNVSIIYINEDNPEYILTIISDISERKNAEAEALYLINHDQLTGFYNRKYYEEQIKLLNSSKNLPISLIIIDVNGLKLFNDAFGNMAGNALLFKTSNILKNECKDSFFTSRISSSSFLVVYQKLGQTDIDNIINRINIALESEFVENIQLSLSIGCAIKKSEFDDILDVYKIAEKNMLKGKVIDSSSMQHRTIEIIMNSLYEKNEREMQHSKRVSVLCEKIANRMNMSQTEVQKLKIAGMMHDIGKIGISDSVLNKAGALTDEEWIELKRHSEAGYRILRAVEEFSEIADCILAHHERWDGRGYPKGLLKNEIPLFSRIIAVSDSYDAMTSDRSYRKAMSEQEAIIELKKCSETQFDPEIVRIFLELIADEIVEKEVNSFDSLVLKSY